MTNQPLPPFNNIDIEIDPTADDPNGDAASESVTFISHQSPLALGAALEFARKARGYGLWYVEERTGIHMLVLADYERGMNRPTLEELRTLSDLYRVGDLVRDIARDMTELWCAIVGDAPYQTQ